MEEIVEKHRAHLPHIQLTEQIIFLTWRLAFTLPRPMLDLLAQMRLTLDMIHRSPEHAIEELRCDYYSQFGKLDEFLGKFDLAGLSLCRNGFGELICGAFRFYDNKFYELHSYCVMPNHVHLLIRPLRDKAGEFFKDSVIVQRIKSYTSQEINRALGRKGKVWSDDYFDRYIRSPKDYYKVVEYILNNPPKAGLASHQDEWPYAWFRRQLI